MPEPAVKEADLGHDLEPLLDQELSRLPDKYRVAIVLCDLEGKTRKEAARQLRVPEGTIASRLATARTMLAKRLTQRGVTLSGGALAAVLTEQAASAGVPSPVVTSTIKAVTFVAAGQAAATGMISVKVAALTEGVLKTMLLTKLKLTMAGLLFVGLARFGAGGLLYQTQAAPAPKVATKTTIDELVDGKKVQPDARSVTAGADAAAKLLAASNLVDFLNPGQQIDKDLWEEQVVAGIENKRSYLRFQFRKPRQIEGNLNGEKVKYSVSDVVFFFFEPGAPQDGPIKNGPVCLWGRNGDRYYFANQIAGHEELVKWLGNAQER